MAIITGVIYGCLRVLYGFIEVFRAAGSSTRKDYNLKLI